jgi:branched-chain amino acid transport system substrate-binding protein
MYHRGMNRVSLSFVLAPLLLVAVACSSNPTPAAAPTTAAPTAAAPAAAKPTVAPAASQPSASAAVAASPAASPVGAASPAAVASPAAQAAAPSAPAAGGGAWNVAVVGPYTGALAASGASFKAGAQLYVDQQNAKGGWVGKQIQLQFVDEGNSDAGSAATAAQKVATDPSVLVVVGHFSSSSALAAGPIYQKAEIPLVVTTASSPAVTQGGNQWLFRTGTTAVLEGRNAVDLMKKLGKSKLAIVFNSADFGKAQDSFVGSAVKAAGFQVVSENDYQPGAQDFSSIVSKLKDVQPDAVWMGMYDTEGGPFVQQASAAGLETTFLGSGALLTDDFLKLAGAAAEGVYSDSVSTAVQAQKSPDLAAFLKAYNDAYHQDPDGFAELMYSDFEIIGQAVTAGGTDRKSLRDKLATTKSFKDANNIGAFDDNRDGLATERQASVVKNGRWELYATFSP